MDLVRSNHLFAVVICVAAATGLSAVSAAARLPTNQSQSVHQPAPSPIVNPPVPTTLTCAEFNDVRKSGNKALLGATILWFDGYYSGRSGLTELPAGWLRTVAQGAGGMCAMTVNAHRTVLDVIVQLHRDYGSQNNTSFPAGGQKGPK